MRLSYNLLSFLSAGARARQSSAPARAPQVQRVVQGARSRQGARRAQGGAQLQQRQPDGEQVKRGRKRFAATECEGGQSFRRFRL